MHWNRWGLGLALSTIALTGLSCTNDLQGAPDPVAGAGANIVNGSVHYGDDGVLYLRIRNGGNFSCTGSLVSERVVLTAKHCVCNSMLGGQIALAEDVTVHVGPTRDSATLYSTVDEIWTDGSATCAPGGADIAYLILTQAGNIQPYPLAIDESVLQVGDQVAGIGYGITDRYWMRGTPVPAGASGIKNLGYAQVQAVSNNVIYTSELTCNGDSGGPLFGPDGSIVGVLSGGINSQFCQDGSRFTAVWTFIQSILDAIDSTRGGTAPDSPPELYDGDQDGVSDAVDLCPNTAPGRLVWFEGPYVGCAEDEVPISSPVESGVDSDYDGVPRSRDLCNGTPRGAAVFAGGDWAGCAVGQQRCGAAPTESDRDLDGYPDSIDMCGDSAPGASVYGTGLWTGCAPTETLDSDASAAALDRPADSPVPSDVPPETDFCSEGFLCRTGDQCIPWEWLCDQFYDCNDASDEDGCSTGEE